MSMLISAAATRLVVALATAYGSSTVGFQQTGTLPLARTVQDKVGERVCIDDFKNAGGLAPGLGADDTQAFSNAIAATIKSGGWGTVEFSAGKTYNIAASSLDGVLGLTLKGKNGGNVGNLSVGSTGGAAVLNFTNATGDSLSFTGVAYHAAQLVLEDIAIFSNTSGNVLKFDNFSQINFKRVSVTNAGGSSVSTGNGIRFSNCYYVNADELYVWKSGTLYTVGNGVTIDKGALTQFLGGLFNFKNSSFYGFYNGVTTGNATLGATTNENYAAINFDCCELNSNSQGAFLLYGAKSVSFTGCYIEGNLVAGVLLANKPRSVNIRCNFFNNPTASSGDVILGLNGVGTSYTQFYDVDISYNHFLGVNKFGIWTASSGAGASYSAEGNEFWLATAGAVAISSNQAATGNLRAFAKKNSFYGFPVGTSMAGYFTEQSDNHEYDSSGNFLGSWKVGAITLSPFVDFTQIQPNDPDATIIMNTTAGARYINPAPSASKNRRQFVTLDPASTQSVRLMKSDGTTQMAVLTAGKAAFMWNAGANEYASLLA